MICCRVAGQTQCFLSKINFGNKRIFVLNFFGYILSIVKGILDSIAAPHVFFARTRDKVL